jgi:hypothetical protein
MNQKVEQQKFLKYLWLLHTPKKLILGHLLMPGSGSDPRRPDPTKRVRIRTDPDRQHWNLASFISLFNEHHLLPAE